MICNKCGKPLPDEDVKEWQGLIEVIESQLQVLKVKPPKDWMNQFILCRVCTVAEATEDDYVTAHTLTETFRLVLNPRGRRDPRRNLRSNVFPEREEPPH